MIFCGDIALPFENAITIKNIPEELLQKQWIGNLEGSLIKIGNSDALLKTRKVFNSESAIKQLLKIIPFKAFNLANNHILDADSIAHSTSILDNYTGLNYVGAGNNLSEASKELVIEDEGQELIILSFGWKAINCIYAKQSKEGVNPYLRSHVLNEVKRVVEKYPNGKIICFFHWNYELEVYPQPFDRELAKTLIRCGIYAIIGCHAHRVQPIEMIDNHPVVYGLGNFAFKQGSYMDGRLKFPDLSLPEIAFEIKGDGSFAVHQFIFRRDISTLEYLKTLPIERAEFDGMSDKEYSLVSGENFSDKVLTV
jgi:hypothetical protein